jgi:hypothetical protein
MVMVMVVISVMMVMVGMAGVMRLGRDRSEGDRAGQRQRRDDSLQHCVSPQLSALSARFERSGKLEAKLGDFKAAVRAGLARLAMEWELTRTREKSTASRSDERRRR